MDWFTEGKVGLDALSSLPPIILFATPIMLLLVLLEFYLGQKEHGGLYQKKDFLSSAAIGIGNLISTAFTKTLTFTIVWGVYYYVAPYAWPTTPTGYIVQFLVCLVFYDYARYWAHRVAHEQRFWWATHVTHHSSLNYNFGVSFRLSWVQQIKLVFFLPVAGLGFDPFVFFVVHQISVLNQFWVHTELIRKMPRVVELFFVTPSHHRVHHGTNEQYIDKNYGSMFILWDKIHGTFEPEGEQASYGIKRQPEGYNPVWLVFHEWVDIFKDLRYVRSLKDFKVAVFGYPGDFDKIREERIKKAA